MEPAELTLQSLKAELRELQIKALGSAVYIVQFGLKLDEAKASKFWKREAATFGQWCEEQCGLSLRRCQQLRTAGKYINSLKLLADCGVEVEIPQTVAAAQKAMAVEKAKSPVHLDSEPKKINQNLSMAKVDNAVPVEYSEPPEPPASLPDRIHACWLAVKDLMNEPNFSGYARFRQLHKWLRQLDAEMIAPKLPGLSDEMPSRKARGSLTECKEHAVKLGLPPRDGEWFHFKAEASGWVINNKPMKDWRAAMRQWQLSGYFPSQKGTTTTTNTTPAADREFERQLRIIDRMQKNG